MDEEVKPKAMDEREEVKKPKAPLSEDVIYGIADQMFFKKPFSDKWMSQIDLTKQNPYTIFMGHCQVHLNAMMAQFAKVKRVEFSTFNDKDEIRFYKHKEGMRRFSDQDGKNAFSGPYHVTKKMAFGIIEYGKLRISAIQTRNYLEKKQKTISADKDVVQQQPFATEQKPIQVFSALFLDENLSEEIANKNCELDIEFIGFHEPAEVIEANFLSLLALNPMEIELNTGADLDHTRAASNFLGCPSNQSNFCAIKTKKFTVNFGFVLDEPISDFAAFDMKWQSQVRSIINACPALELLQIRFGFYFNIGFAPDHALQHLNAAVNIVQNLLKQLDEGNEKLRVSFDFTGICGDQEAYQALASLADTDGHEKTFFTFGTPFAVDISEIGSSSPYTARSSIIVDKTGQRTHECKFKVFGETLPSPEMSFAYDYDLSDDDDNYYGNSGDDDDGGDGEDYFDEPDLEY